MKRKSKKVKLTKKQDKELDALFEQKEIDETFLSEIFGQKTKYVFNSSSSRGRNRHALYHFYKKITA